MEPEIAAHTMRTTVVTEGQWICVTSTTMEDNSIASVEDARQRNLAKLHANLAVPPGFDSTVSTWREPWPDMTVTVLETLYKHDMMTGKILSEDQLEKYKIPYQQMNPEEN